MSEADRLVRQTPVEYFREQLEKAMEHQRVTTSAFTEHYLVNLLARSMRGATLPAPEPGFDEMPLALLYVRALNSSRSERARLLRLTGDMALFVSGFFSESLSRGSVDAGYYRCLGGYAYGLLSQDPVETGVATDVFGELAARFPEFSDVLQEVSELSQLGSPQSLVRLYERWLATGSRRAASLLQERGINPVPPGELRAQ